MEETNFPRHAMLGEEESSEAMDSPRPVSAVAEEKTGEKSASISDGPSPVEIETGTISSTKLPRTYWDKIKLIRTADLKKKNHILGMMWRPLVFLTFPVIFYAGFSYGSNLVWFNVLNATASLILANSPYNFKPSMVGLSYVSPLIGVAIGSFYTGVLGDKFVLKLARKRGGILESEYRLWLFAPSLLLIPGGLILWGVGAAHHVHWFGVVFAMGIIALTNTIGLQLSVDYCINSYKDLSGEAMVTVILVRNTMSFAIGYGITPWVDNMGLQNAFITAAFAGLAQCLTFLLMVKYGKRLRQMSMKRYAKYVEQMAAVGMIH
jgi:hypothetical protein